MLPAAGRQPRSACRQRPSLAAPGRPAHHFRSEEHTSELQSLRHLVCRLLLEKKNRLHIRHTRQSSVSQFHLVPLVSDTATTDIYTLSLHDALPISLGPSLASSEARRLTALGGCDAARRGPPAALGLPAAAQPGRTRAPGSPL